MPKLVDLEVAFTEGDLIIIDDMIDEDAAGEVLVEGPGFDAF